MKPIVPMEKFVEFGFKPCKQPYKNCYYLCVSRGIKMLFVSPLTFAINPWEDDDPRIHKRPNCRYKDLRTAEDIIVDLAKLGYINSSI